MWERQYTAWPVCVLFRIFRLLGFRCVVTTLADTMTSCSAEPLCLRSWLWLQRTAMDNTSGYNGSEVLLDFPRVGRFLVRAGKEILIDPAPASDADEVRAYLLGTAFGMLCHQRGITPLHASAIDVADGCVAFVGASGAGKSTLVAALAQRGHEIISDDVCFLQLDGKGKVQARPGIERIRLWEDAMYALGYDGPGVEREMHGYNKYFIPVRSPRNPLKLRRLRRVYELHSAPDGAIEVTRLHGAAAVEVLMQNVYRLGLAERLGYKPRAFMVCAAAARDVPVFRLSRPKHFHALEETVECPGRSFA